MDLMEIVSALLQSLFPLLIIYIFFRMFLRVGSSSVRSARKAHYRAFKS